MRIHSAYGGQSRETEDDYVEGPPELLCEVADSSKAIDLRQKREDYEQAGVIEYLVLVVSKPELHWFHFPTQRNIRPNREGIAKSRVFPGLWIDVPALLARKVKQLIHVLQQGLASPQHAAFVKRLEAQRKRLEKHGR
jgi:Uma2 family endonuclease